MITKDDYQLLRLHPAFSNIPVELFDKLAIEISSRTISKGQVLFYSGDRRDRFFLLVEGYARIEQFDSSDQFSYMDYIKKGALLPFGGIFQDERYHYTASAVTDLRCFVIPVNLYEACVQGAITVYYKKTFIYYRISRIAPSKCCHCECKGKGYSVLSDSL